MGTQRFLTIALVDGMQINDASTALDKTVREAITATLNDWFLKVTMAASANDTSWSRSIRWVEDPTQTPAGADPDSMREPNLICYFVPNPRQGSLTCLPHFDVASIDGQSKGYTAIPTEFTIGADKKPVGKPRKTLAASEVYCSRLGASNAKLLAAFAFHELMHNAQQMGDEMHAKQRGIAAEEITEGTVPTPENIRDMAAALNAGLLPQWKTGRTCILLRKADGI